MTEAPEAQLHPNILRALGPHRSDRSPAATFIRLVDSTPTWVWVVRVRHVTDVFGGIYLGPMLSRELADRVAETIEQMRMPGVRELCVEKQPALDMPLEFVNDSDWSQVITCLNDHTKLVRVAWLVDYLMRGA